ncbi:MAG: glycosyltransferase [Propionibacteriaceae bacterium]|nr:glycosyltransferase [Propionibacteriaceae bacterium]
MTRHKRGFIVFAARLQPLKAPDLAIAGLAHVPEPIRPDLIVAGDDSPDFADYPAYLHALVDEFGLDDYVHLVGPQDRAGLAWLLRRAVLCLVPSHSETFGLVALEAAASGTPVLAAARGGLREAVVHGESGRLMDSRQPEDWGVAMTKLLSDRRGLAGMGVVARVHARRFSWAATASQLERLYRQVLLPTGRATALPDPAATTGSDSTPGSGPGSTHDSAATDAEPTPPGTSPSGDAERRPTSPADRPARRRQAQRYLFLHAHPDDETLGTGPIILALVRAGAEPIIVTATRGELGEVTPRVARTLGRAGLTTRRLSERTRAIAQLGAWDAGFLGTPPNRAPGQDPRVYSDSGMAWVTPTVAGPAPQSPATALCRAPLDEVVADVVACARHWRADSLVSYDAAGGYGHPDHVRCHQAGRRAARELGLPFWEIVTPQTGAGASTGTDSAEVTVYEAGPGLERLIAAHQAYSSQFTVTADHQGLVHVGGQAAPLLARAGLRLILPPSDGPDSSGDGPD